MLLNAIPIRSVCAALAFSCASCASVAPEPRTLRADIVYAQASSAARLAYEQGDFAQAQRLYHRALARARAINDAGSGADAAYNTAMSEIGLGNYEAADALLSEAYYDAHRASSNTADIVLLRAKVAYLRERLPEALILIDDVARANASPSLQLQAIILRGQIAGDIGDADAAKSELRAVEIHVASSGAPLTSAVRADLAKLEGTIARLEAKVDAAAHFFDAESELLRSARRYRDMSRALARAAEAHLAAGSPLLAADRFFLAARSLDARGETGPARSLLEASVAAAEKGGDMNARGRARRLLDEITRRAFP